jgi:hypothetical protein
MRIFVRGEIMSIRTTLLIFFTCFSVLAFGQFEDVQLNMDGDWHILKSEQGVDINYKFEVCDQFGRQVGKYILQFENLNSDARQISFSTQTYMNRDCSNCGRLDVSEYMTSVLVDGNSSLEGMCGENNKELEFFSHYIVHVPGMSRKHLTDLKIVNLVIE